MRDRHAQRIVEARFPDLARALARYGRTVKTAYRCLGYSPFWRIEDSEGAVHFEAEEFRNADSC